MAFLTLRSMGADAPDFARRGFCLVCGTRGLADLILNWMLFIPLGIGLGWITSLRRAVVVSLLVTLGIEAFQVFLPGRVTSIHDIVTNALGGATGAWLAVNARTRPAALVVLTGVAVAWLVPAWLLRPVVTETDLYGHWNSGNPGFQTYYGEVLDARLGDLPLRSTRLDDQQGIRAALRDRAPLTVRIVAGPPPPALAQIVAVYDGREREQILVGVIGTDLLVRGRTVAGRLRLDRPDARWRGALADLAPGDTATIRVDRGRASLCMAVDDREACGLAPGPGDGWAFLLNLEGGHDLTRTIMALLYALGAGLLLGLYTPSRSTRASFAGAVALAGLVAGWWSPDLRPDLLHAAVLVCGAAVGGLVQKPAVRAFTLLAARPL